MSARLKQLPGVVVIPRDDALKKRHAESRIWNETWLAAFFHKPCNHELFVLQSLNMEGELLPCNAIMPRALVATAQLKQQAIQSTLHSASKCCVLSCSAAEGCRPC